MNVLITGGSRGIGASCVRAFCNRGDRVAFFYKSAAEAATQLATETGALAICADVSDARSVKDAVAKAEAWMGGIDVLVNNAGIAQIKLFTDLDDADWKRMIDTNLGGAFYVTRAVAKGMIARQSGKIVNIGSMWGKVGASCEVAYSASKAAIEGFTKALAKELGPSGITVNCIEPGVINTEMNAELDEETLRELCDETPVGKIGDAGELADFIFKIATEKSGFLTGQIIGFDGGFAI
jgi:3-oxoacyl-[acyl-carrier protein] reductase